MRYNFLLVALLFAFSTSGQSIDDLTLDRPDGGSIAISKAAPGQTVVVLFVSVNCPYSKYYKDRIEAIVRENSKARFLLVNSNISEFGQKNPFSLGSTAPYLYDKKQELANALNARKCPEAFVLSKSGGKYEIKYSGAIDDSPQLADDVQEKYLVSAINQVLAGYPVSPKTTRPTGCMIRRN